MSLAAVNTAEVVRQVLSATVGLGFVEGLGLPELLEGQVVARD